MKKVAFVLPGMSGGGAEHVAALLSNTFSKQNIKVKYFLTHAHRETVVRCDLSEEVPLLLFQEMMPPATPFEKCCSRFLQLLSSLLCKPLEAAGKAVPAALARLSIVSQYGREIRLFRGLMKAEPDLTVIAFLQPAIPITLLASEGLPNRIIFSERGDPERLMKKRYGRKFIEKYYTRADAAVFQTEDAMRVYPKYIAEKGVVIPNPIKSDLPKPYHGERNKCITTFCRIANQKNLPLLIDAFALLYRDHPDCKLRIIGDAPNTEGVEVLEKLKGMIADHHIAEAVIFEPFNANVHEAIVKDAMYVNSSDYEGISNAMLEAMAIGLPVICTDCPIGGARATIQDGENGLLVPVGDADALYRAMKRLVKDDDLAARLSENASTLRDSLSLSKIAEKWLHLL